MDMYGYKDILQADRLDINKVMEITNMSDITDATPHGCDNGALTDRFGVLIQGLLGVVAFSTLMLKRFREPASIRRPWRIWFYDTSKQAIGALFIHLANVFLSTLTEEDPCSLYLINFLLDATLGMLFIWAGVRLVAKLVEVKQWTLLTFGEYGDPPQAAAWLGQCGFYLLIMVLEKGVVSLVLLVPGWTNLQAVLLSYITDPQLELVLVMLIVPFIVNAIMFWVVDSLMMRKYKTTKSVEDSCDGGPAPRRSGSLPFIADDESQVLLTVDTDTEDTEEGEEGEEGGEDQLIPPTPHFSAGAPRPSWVVV